MPKTRVVFFRESDGTAPVLDWLRGLNDKARDKCVVRIERLRDLGHELRRPEADYLRDGIYELRSHYQTINYRIMYFFHGKDAVVLAHALTKEQRVPSADIEIAPKRKRRYEAGPARHTLEV
ncbi:MAG: type II toxin-antitoxin system RelE/ParE family toxin [Candidatus Hydrogenedentes bacterium]|nr:type II toxin-antitoxin system RelE/ParE family toxin [Candidatus Hydrogenedentota bacterium]